MKKLCKKIRMGLIFVALICLLNACTNKDDATRALQNSGYTNIQIDGYGWFACGKDDFYHTKFTATNPVGQQVDGVVCSGLLFKGATIRF